MTQREDGGPAFPSANSVRAGDVITGGHAGLSLRDYFAAKALPEALAFEMSEKGSYRHFCPAAAMNAAINAYDVADAMLARKQS